MSQEQLVQRIRESLLRLQQTQSPPSKPARSPTSDVRDSVRKLSRQRISDILRQLRAANGLSYEQINDLTGLSQQLLFDVEFKDARLTLDDLRKLLACYHVSVNDLLGIDID
jgi:ribosome-binding protein aMBF1 (putative translation factor)